MTLGKVAWKMLRTMRDSIIVQEQEPCPAEVEQVIYDPYKKVYLKRKPTQRKTLKQEMQILLQENEDDNDHIWIGDKMPEVNEEGTIRLWLQNWNGAEKWNEHKIMYQLSTLVDNNIHYFSIIESRINQYHKETNDKWRKCKERIMPNGDILLTSVPGVPTTTVGQPGGILSGYNGPLKTKYTTHKRDPMGRWHYHEFYGKERNLRIYSLYRVNPGNASTEGDTTYWTQQKNYMNLQNDRRNPRKAVIDDFISEVQTAIDNKMSIIVLADFNERVDGPEKNNERFREMGLINMMEEYIGREALPRTCTKGPNCIDHIWMTSNVLENIHQAGFAPFEFIKASDHRGIFVDLYYKNVLDDSMHNLEAMKRRNLKSTIPNRVEKYIGVVTEQWEYHKITGRFLEIQKSMEQQVTEENIKELNKLDKQITEIMMYGEKKCSNVPAHSIGAWSVKLKNAIRAVIDFATARTKAKKVKPSDNIEEAIKEFKIADENWKQAKEEYKDVQKNSKELRKTHIRECAEANVERTGNTTVESEIKRLQTIEEQREIAERLKSVMKPFNKAGFTTVMIPALTAYTVEERREPGFDHHDIDRMWKKILPQNGKNIKDWERITDKKIVQDLMLKWQRKHFTQAQESPCGTTEWNDILRNKEVQQKILEGQYEVDSDMPIELQELFDQMKRPECIKEELPYRSTYKEFIAFIKGSSERRSTSPSGRGYNHYKSLLVGEAREQLETIHDIIELARSKNIILDRWRNTVTTLMEKDPGRPKIHRMRALHIIEAEVQFIAKLFYCKKLLQNAEKHDLITGQQYGGRKGKQAQSVVLNKMMYYNITHQQLLEAAFMDDDARNCYDRILTAMSAVEMRSWGQSYEEAEFSVEFLQKQKYFIKTGLGITEDHYTYSREDPTHGSGQGIGWAGIKFTRTSDTVCKIMKEKCAGMHFQNPCKSINVKRNGDIFVDDTALGVTMNCAQKRNALLQLKEDQQKHAYLLYSSGHKLALDKCAFYWIRFVRDGVKQRHQMNHELPGQLTLKEGYNMEEKQIKRLQPFQCHRTLGQYVSVTGNQKRQKKEIQKKIKEWCDKLRTRYLNGTDTLYAYQTYLVMSIRYMISSSCLTYKECDELGKQIEPILMNAFTIQRNCARTVLYSPVTFGGFGIEHIYHIQCFEKLRFFLMHIRRNDVTGKLFQICMDWTQREVGTKRHFLQERFNDHSKRITKTWITHLWEYSNACKMEIINTDYEKNPPVRDNDFYIMDAIREAPISEEQKQKFNQVRLKLKVETTADIVYLNSGTRICSNIYHGTNYRGSREGWPNILEYPQQWIENWKNILQEYILPKLQSRPLGAWKRKSHQQFKTYTNSDQSILKINEEYYEWSRNNRVYIPTDRVMECVIPVDIEQRNGGYRIVAILHDGSENENTHDKKNFLEWEKRNLGTIDFQHPNIEVILEELRHNNIVAASDGSVLNGSASHAYCIAKKDTNEILIAAAAPVDGKKTSMTSFRPEASGALAVIQFLEYISERYDIPQANVIIYIDNAETIQVMKGEKDVYRFSNGLDDHIDVAIELYERKQQSKNTYIPEKVKSHMDDNTTELTKSQELNVYVDNIAGEFMANPPPRLYPHEYAPIMRQQKFVLIQNDAPVVTDIKETLIISCMEDAIITYNKKHHGIDLTQTVFDNQTMGRILLRNKKKLGKRVKNIQNQWDTRDRNYEWGKSKSNICTLCHQEPETWQHIYTCQCQHMKRKSRENIEFIEKELKKIKTEPTLLQHLLNLIKNWRTSPQLPDHASNTPYYAEIREAHEDQMTIGFEAFAKGYISRKWQKVQDVYYKKEIRDRKYNTERWNNKILTLIIDRGNILWEERCEIIHTAKIDTNERRYREFLMDLLVQTRDKKQLNPKDYHILQRKRKFFMNAPKPTLEMWHLRLLGMVRFESERRKSEGSDIRKFIITKKRRRRQRIPTMSPEPKSYHQQTLWKTLQPTNSMPVARTQPATIRNREENTYKRKRIMDKLVRKRKRQSQIIATKITGNRTQENNNKVNQSAKSKKRPHTIRQTTYTKRKKSKQSKILQKRSTVSIRDLIRKAGKDPKTDR